MNVFVILKAHIVKKQLQISHLIVQLIFLKMQGRFLHQSERQLVWI